MKIVKWVLGFVLLLAVLAAAAAATFFFVLHPKKKDPPDVKAPTSAEAIERGRYLANHVAVCMGCHSEGEIEKPGDPPKPNMLGSGRTFPEIPGFPGRMRSPNLTPDPTHGIGKFTDGEILRAMREGIGRDGRVLFPMMPYQNYGQILGDDDALAIIAYLRTLAPNANAPGAMEVKFPVSMFIRLAPKPVEGVLPPAPTAKLERGRWLLRMANCADCHTPSEKGAPIAGMEFAGGGSFPWPSGGELTVPNITPDQATGIGAYTDEDLLRVLNEGKNKAGQDLYLMPWPHYKGMTDDDKLALIAALREVKPIQNVVKASTIKR